MNVLRLPEFRHFALTRALNETLNTFFPIHCRKLGTTLTTARTQDGDITSDVSLQRHADKSRLDGEGTAGQLCRVKLTSVLL